MQCTVSQATKEAANTNSLHMMRQLGMAYANGEITKEALKPKKKELLDAWKKERKQGDTKQQKDSAATKPTSRRSSGTICKRPASATRLLGHCLEQVAKKPGAAAATHGRAAKAGVEKEEKEAAQTQVDAAEGAEEEEEAAQIHGVHGAAGECEEGQEEEEGPEQVSLNGMCFNIGLSV